MSETRSANVTWVGAVCFLDAPLWAAAGWWGGGWAVLAAVLFIVAVVVIVGVALGKGGEVR